VLLCDAVQGCKTLYEDIARIHPKAVEDGRLDAIIEELVAADILLREGNFLLTLPIGKKSRSTEDLRAYVLGTEAPVDGPVPDRSSQRELLPVLA